MYKIAIFIILTLAFNACSYFTFNGAMCDQIASNPNQAVPKECRNYKEKEADKAFDKVVDGKKISDKNIKFDKEEEDE